MIRYTDSIDGIGPSMLEGFFDGWPNPPSPETHLKVLANSFAVVLAVDDATEKVVGFVTAISDGVLSAFIPLLEVLPSYRGNGIGGELVGRMLAKLKHLYGISLMCDEELQPFYTRFCMMRGSGMNIRNYDKQSGSDV